VAELDEYDRKSWRAYVSQEQGEREQQREGAAGERAWNFGAPTGARRTARGEGRSGVRWTSRAIAIAIAITIVAFVIA
jgi:hypothetical protein